MKLEERIEALVALGVYLKKDTESLVSAINKAHIQNGWFDVSNVRNALDSIAGWLQRDVLQNWVNNYEFKSRKPKKLGLILAGNIPMVGFHDIMSVFLSGHIANIKLSEKDNILIPHCIDYMIECFPEAKNYFEFPENFKDIDAIIATGSNNSASIFTSYFKHLPHIIRRNRNAVAIISGDESDYELIALGNDVFSFYGLGCRNVSKLYVPKSYSFDHICGFWYDHFKDIVNNNKYKNNFDYNYAIYLLNKAPFLANECIILLESDHIPSPISCVHYSYYEDLDSLKKKLEEHRDEIQLVVSHKEIDGLETFRPGQAQHPEIDQYADNVDTLSFLSSL